LTFPIFKVKKQGQPRKRETKKKRKETSEERRGPLTARGKKGPIRPTKISRHFPSSGLPASVWMSKEDTGNLAKRHAAQFAGSRNRPIERSKPRGMVRKEASEGRNKKVEEKK
jgi:hypothetical protein